MHQVDGDGLARRSGSRTRWFTPENPTGEPGAAGQENGGHKGRAFVPLPAGDRLELARAEGSGTVRRIWLTLSDLGAEVLGGVHIEMTWDDAAEPAVRVPLGAFFGAPLGRLVPFESALLSSPEGRSLCCVFPMPFRTGARIALVNGIGARIDRVFYEIDVTLGDRHDEDTLWLHAAWEHAERTVLGEPFVALPEVTGAGRFLGLQLGVRTPVEYGATWWGEGEVRMRVDTARGLTLSGTGVEDYAGTGWGMGAFAGRLQGCPVAEPGDGTTEGAWTPYRLHVDDPVWFEKCLEVTVDAIGGAPTSEVLELAARGVPTRPITVDVDGVGLMHLVDPPEPRPLDDPAFAGGWTNFLREDDWSATSWYYLDRP